MARDHPPAGSAGLRLFKELRSWRWKRVRGQGEEGGEREEGRGERKGGERKGGEGPERGGEGERGRWEEGGSPENRQLAEGLPLTLLTQVQFFVACANRMGLNPIPPN